MSLNLINHVFLFSVELQPGKRTTLATLALFLCGCQCFILIEINYSKSANIRS